METFIASAHGGSGIMESLAEARGEPEAPDAAGGPELLEQAVAMTNNPMREAARRGVVFTMRSSGDRRRRLATASRGRFRGAGWLFSRGAARSPPRARAMDLGHGVRTRCRRERPASADCLG